MNRFGTGGRAGLVCLWAMGMLAGPLVAETLFYDAFDRVDGPVANGWTVEGGGNSAIFSNALRMTTGGLADREWIHLDQSGFGQGMDARFDASDVTLGWQVAFTSSRDSLGGFDPASYALALVMGASAEDFTAPGVRGYAVLLGNQGAPDPLRLQYFTNGLLSNAALDTNAAPAIATWDPGGGRFNGNENFLVRVTYSPVSDTWTLAASTNLPSWPQAGAAQVVAAGVHAPREDLPFSGLFFNHSTGGHYARWDEFAIATFAPEPLLQAGDIDVAAVGETTAELTWAPGDGVGRLVVMRQDAPVDVVPEPGRAYVGNPGFGLGDALGPDTYVMAVGDVSDENISGLQPATTYHVRLFEYGRTGGDAATTTYSLAEAEENRRQFTTTGVAPDTTSVIESSAVQLTGVTLSALATNVADTRALFACQLADSGDGDGLPTDVEALVLIPGGSNTVPWDAVLTGVSLSNVTGNMEIPLSAVTMTSGAITLTVASGGLVVADAESVELHLRARLKAGAVPDGGVLALAIPAGGHGARARAGGSQFDATFPALIESPVWPLSVTATRLAFIDPPDRVLVKQAFALEVEAQDAAGNVDVDVHGTAALVASPGAPLQGLSEFGLFQGRGQAGSQRATRPGVFSLETRFGGLEHAQSGLITAEQGLNIGAIGLVGLQNNASNGPDPFAFAALDWLPRGTTLYFTDNGWEGTAFRGVNQTDGSGAEGLLAFTALEAIAPGTIIQSYEAQPHYAWSTQGPIPGASGSWSELAFSQDGDQLVVLVAATTNNPLHEIQSQRQLFLLDYTEEFESAVSSSTGDLPPDCREGHNALSLPNAPVWRLNLDGQSRSRAAWLAYMANPTNWLGDTEGPLPSGTLSVLAPTGLLLTVW